MDRTRKRSLDAQSGNNAQRGLQAGGEKKLTGKKEEPSELLYFKVYKNQIPVIEQAIETGARMLRSDKSRSYCLEMICADFLAGAHLDDQNPETLFYSMTRFFQSCLANNSKPSLTAWVNGPPDHDSPDSPSHANGSPLV